VAHQGDPCSGRREIFTAEYMEKNKENSVVKLAKSLQVLPLFQDDDWNQFWNKSYIINGTWLK
jgi:hypothetical protein